MSSPAQKPPIFEAFENQWIFGAPKSSLKTTLFGLPQSYVKKSPKSFFLNLTDGCCRWVPCLLWSNCGGLVAWKACLGCRLFTYLWSRTKWASYTEKRSEKTWPATIIDRSDRCDEVLILRNLFNRGELLKVGKNNLRQEVDEVKDKINCPENHRNITPGQPARLLKNPTPLSSSPSSLPSSSSSSSLSLRHGNIRRHRHDHVRRGSSSSALPLLLMEEISFMSGWSHFMTEFF